MDMHEGTGPGDPEAPGGPPERVAVVADDLIWGSRLRVAVERAGALPVAVGRASAGRGERPSGPLRGAIVDLGPGAGDGVTAVQALAAAGVAVIAVGQHDDGPLRQRARDAGAARVYSYDKLFRDGPAVVRRWLAGLAGRP